MKKLVELKPDRIEEYPRAVLLWNHRWEYDKNPEGFFDALFELQDRGVDFRLVVLGANFSRNPEIFDRAGARLADKILHFGFVEDERDYVKWLWHSDIVPVTSHHDFFGASMVQAMYCDVAPLLPARLAYPEHIPENKLPDLAASIQSAITDVLVKKTMDASFESQSQAIIIAGGVSANSDLRKKFKLATQKAGIKFIAPEMSLCMDNAAMIAYIAEQKALSLGLELFNDLTFTVKANSVKQNIKLSNRGTSKPISQ